MQNHHWPTKGNVMHAHRFYVAAGLAFRRARALIVLVVLFLAAGITGVAAQNTVPGEFQGTWVPTHANCQSPVRVQVSAQVLTLVNGKDSAAIGGIEMAGPGYFAPDYRGIMAVLITEFNGHQPVTAMFNYGEKRGVAQVEFSPVIARANNAQAKAYNARISKLNLAKRFPLNKVPLKKCA
jgi:hypothetical protein